jgi:hypothetical protein
MEAFMPSDSFLAKVQSSFQQLTEAATDLNSASDSLGRSISELDLALKKLNLGIRVWVTAQSDEEDASYRRKELGYAKVDGRWGIALRTVSGNYNDPDERDYIEEWLFNDAPRNLRIGAIGKIPELLAALSNEASETTKLIKGKLAEAEEVATAIKQATEPPQRKVIRTIPQMPGSQEKNK